MARITAPVEGFSGKVVGVVFDKGKAETDDMSALAYFRRRGYTVDNTLTGDQSPDHAGSEETPGDEGRQDPADAPEDDQSPDDAKEPKAPRRGPASAKVK